MNNSTKIMIFGATGMLGHTLMFELIKNKKFKVYGTVRDIAGLEKYFSNEIMENLITGVDAFNFESIEKAVAKVKPVIIINCIGIIKQLPASKDPVTAISINALFPHKVAQLCQNIGARMIHISTDCVFDGKKGEYTEEDKATADDLYGLTKYLGEVIYDHAVTIRTSIIGHELNGHYSLIEWFLSQVGKVNGYTNAIYTGFPTVEISQIIENVIIPNKEIKGLYQVSSEPISKYDLLKLVAEKYKKKIEIHPYDGFCENKSLNSMKFRSLTGYKPPSWPELVDKMHKNFVEFKYNRNLNS